MAKESHLSPNTISDVGTDTEGGTRSDARFCHKFSCEFQWPVGHTAVAVQPSNKQPAMLGELPKTNVQNLYVREVNSRR